MLVHGEYLCKICYTGGTNAFYLLYALTNKAGVDSIEFNCIFTGYFEFQNGHHILPFLTNN